MNTYDVKHTKGTLMHFADNEGSDQPAGLGLPCPLTESVDTVVLCQRTENVQIRLHGCTSTGPLLFADGIMTFFLCCTSYVLAY